MSDRLFDPPGPKVTVGERVAERRRERAAREAPPGPVVVALGDTWRLIERAKKPEVHAYKGPWLIKVGPDKWMDAGSIQTACGVVGIPLTAEPGQRAAACLKCLAAGAQP